MIIRIYKEEKASQNLAFSRFLVGSKTIFHEADQGSGSVQAGKYQHQITRPCRWSVGSAFT